MKTFGLYIMMSAVVAVLGLASVAPAATVRLYLEPTSSPTVAPGGSVTYQVRAAVVDDGNLGLATVGFDIETDTGRGQNVVTQGPAMDPFVSTAGLNNLPGGFTGQVVGDDLLGIGGAQNTIGNDGISPNPASPSGTVSTGIGLRDGVVVASGTIQVPSTGTSYTVSLTNAFAGVLSYGGTGPVWPVEEATVDVQAGSFQITVSATAPHVFAGLDTWAYETDAVAVHATASDYESDPLTYTWTQQAGLTVTLSGADTADAGFAAPAVATVVEAELAFQAAVADPYSHSASDSVNVRVYMLGDATHDDSVDTTDIIAIGAAWPSVLGDPNFDPWCDFNEDDAIDVDDLMVITENWTRMLSADGSGSSMQAGQGSSQALQGGGGGLESGSTLPDPTLLISPSLYDALQQAGLLEVYMEAIGAY